MSTDMVALDAYLVTTTQDLCDLDSMRRHAEQDCASGETWNSLAELYKRQGRDAQAASCRRRAEHYASLIPVSTETGMPA